MMTIYSFRGESCQSNLTQLFHKIGKCFVEIVLCESVLGGGGCLSFIIPWWEGRILCTTFNVRGRVRHFEWGRSTSELPPTSCPRVWFFFNFNLSNATETDETGINKRPLQPQFRNNHSNVSHSASSRGITGTRDVEWALTIGTK